MSRVAAADQEVAARGVTLTAWQRLSASAHGPRARWVAGFAVVGIVLFVAYLFEARQVPVQSDGAANALQAWDMLHGNWLLHGWMLTDISFYPTELPELALAEALRGLGPQAAQIASAFTYTLVVLGAAALAKGRASGKEGLVRALIAAGIMLAPTLGSTAGTLLNDPDHTGTQVPLLIVWLILDRARRRRYLPVLVAVLLVWGQVADPLATYEGALPLAAVCLIRLYWRRADQDADQDADQKTGVRPVLRAGWYELWLAVGAVASIAAAALLLRLISQLHGFKISQPITTFAVISDLAHQVSVTAESILVVFGADFSGTRLGGGAFIPLLHLAGVGLAAWAIVRALRRFGSADLVVQVLAVAAVILLAAFTVSGYPDVVSGPHQIVGLLAIGAVLAGKLLAGPLIRGRHLGVLLVLLGCYAGTLIYEAAQPPASDVNTQLATWLRAHHLTYGLASYWNASSVTVDSGGAVAVRPVNLSRGYLQAIKRDTRSGWYSAGQHRANFLIVPPDNQSCSAGSAIQWRISAELVFGQPAAIYHVAGLDVLVWRENLLPRVWPAGGSMC